MCNYGCYGRLFTQYLIRAWNYCRSAVKEKSEAWSKNNCKQWRQTGALLYSSRPPILMVQWGAKEVSALYVVHSLKKVTSRYSGIWSPCNPSCCPTPPSVRQKIMTRCVSAAVCLPPTLISESAGCFFTSVLQISQSLLWQNLKWKGKLGNLLPFNSVDDVQNYQSM